MNLKKYDRSLYLSIKGEQRRQREHVELIASENYVSKAVLKAQGSILTNKYAEGYPGNRYYGGCEYVDEIENLAIKRLKRIFNVEYVNVQPHSGSQANAAVYLGLLKPGDKVLGMRLNDGGHLTHGYHLNFSGAYYETFTYGVEKETEVIDYEEVRKKALEVKPQLIIAGASAYPRAIDFKKFREIADEVGAYLLADIAHISGLVAAGLHESPVGHAHVITSTTHKTLRGARGGIVMTNDEKIARQINRAVFPGLQGGPLMHVIAGKAIAFKEALEPSFIIYQKQVLKNAEVLSETLIDLGYRLVSGGTDNHLMLVDIKEKHGITGLEAEQILSKVNITCNKNGLPFDTERPRYTSGIRLGTPAVTTRGLKEKDMVKIATWIDVALTNRDDSKVLEQVKKEVRKHMRRFPMFRKEVGSYDSKNKKYS